MLCGKVESADPTHHIFSRDLIDLNKGGGKRTAHRGKLAMLVGSFDATAAAAAAVAEAIADETEELSAGDSL